MSKILQELSENKICLEVALQRLLIIANKTSNNDLAGWCNKELNGYSAGDELPDYRKSSSRNIYYTGLHGSLTVSDAPIGPGYLKEDTIKQIEQIYITDNIVQVEKNMNGDHHMRRDLTMFAGEVLKNTHNGFDGVRCTSIYQLVPESVYSAIYSNVKTRIINLLCSFESIGLDIDDLDASTKKYDSIRPHNNDLFQKIIINGGVFEIAQKKNKILWNIVVPIITAIVSGVIVYLITYFLIK